MNGTCLSSSGSAGNLIEWELLYVLRNSTPEAKIIIGILVVFSVFAWTVMVNKTLQMRRAKKLNLFFRAEFKSQKNVLGIFDRRLQVDGCPMFMVYEAAQHGARTRGSRTRRATGANGSFR